MQAVRTPTYWTTYLVPRASAIAIVLGYLLLLASGWVLNAPVGYDGVLRPEPHELTGGRGFTVLEVEPGSPADRAGVAAGDFVTAVDGNPFVFDVHQTYHNRGAGKPGTLRLGTGPTSTVVSFTLESRLNSPGIVLGLVLASLLGIATVAIGAGVALVRPGHLAAWLLLGFAVALAITRTDRLWHWTQQQAAHAVALDWLTSGTFVLGTAALLHLLLIFPAPGRLHAKLRGRIWLFYAAAFAPSAFLPIPHLADWSWAVATVVSVCLLITALFALEFSYRHPTTPLARAQLGWIRWGLGVGIGATVLYKLAFLAVPTAIPAVANTLVDVAWLAFPVSLAFAVLRYRLFEVPRIIRASITLGILAAIVLAAYLALVVGGGKLAAAALGPKTGGDDPTVSIVAALVVAALVHPIRVRLQRALERHVYRQRFARQRALEQSTDFMLRPRTTTELTRFLSQDVPRLLSLARGWMTMPTEWARFFEAEPGVLLPNLTPGAPPLLDSLRSVDGPVLLARPEDLDAYEAMPALSVDTPGATAWYTAGARVLVPVRGADGGLLGIWVLSAPLSGDLLEREDLAALARIAAQAGAQLERELARASVRAEPTLQSAVAAADADSLTPREREVLNLLARGYTNRQIADELVIGVRTAETHVDRILRKLSLETRAQAMVWAHEHAARVEA